MWVYKGSTFYKTLKILPKFSGTPYVTGNPNVQKYLICSLENNAYFLLFCLDRKSTRLNSSHSGESRMPSSA